jgi:Interferon-related developmental regulator (IFRD)
LNATSRRYQKGSWEGSKYEVLMDEVKQRIAELATQSSHHVSKKDKKEQRASFREYMSTIVDDESPELVINFRNNGSITLTTWKEIIPLNFLRHSLQSGFQTQLLYNPTIQHLFNVQHSLSNSYSGSMSQVEKRLIMSKTSDAYKNADQKLRKNRDKRENIKNHFITVDGDDI